MAYEIEFAEAVEGHLTGLTARERSIVFQGIEYKLKVETRHRKPMRPNPLAAWELRLGNLRVDYRVLEEPKKVVQVVAVGVKKREQIWIGGERVEL